jgi:hypothetical protein
LEFGWLPGQNSLELTDLNAGVPAGKYNPYHVLETHYKNPLHLANETDTSGLRMTYTSRLREHDVGVMILGEVSLGLDVDSKGMMTTPDFRCPSACTKKFPGPLNLILGNVFHMHELGYNITTRHIRNGKELVPLGKIRNWDYRYVYSL